MASFTSRAHGGARLIRHAFATGAACLAAGCATYSPLPLPDRPQLAPVIDQLAHDHPLPAEPLTVAEITALAVQNNPDLRAARAQHGVSEAQLIQAGVLPNPQLGLAVLPLLAGVGSTTAWNAALSFDFGTLVTLSARRDAAEQAVRQVDADILWREWQVAGQARLLAIDLIEGARNLALLNQTRDLLRLRAQRVQAAVASRDLSLADAAPYLAAEQATQAQINDLQATLLSQRHQLNALLGLDPDAAAPLADTPDLPALDTVAIERELPSLADRRPDLVALQLGYRAQDAKLRAALLAQFPNLTLGVTGGSDNANVRNGGPTMSVGLPIFDRNQGGVALEQATRVQLREEYAARLAAAVGEVKARLREIAILQRQLDEVRRDLPAAERTAARAEAALRTRDIDQRAYVDLATARLAKASQLVTLEQGLLRQQAAIATLTGAGLPMVQTLTSEARR